VTLALVAAVGLAVSYGLATVLQSVEARRATPSEGLDPGLLVRLLGSLPYLAGLALDGVGFLLTVVALQTLPLFVVEAFTAGALAVTAVAAAAWLRLPLSRGEWLGVAAVTAGLVALGLSALGAVAGFGFGLVGIATRLVADPISLTGLLSDPAAYAVVLAGALSLLALATALQRGSVTSATSAMVVAETIIPSLIGLALLGDRIRDGYQLLAAGGLLLAVAGSVALARLGELPDQQPVEAT
jgi:hypothetical protein